MLSGQLCAALLQQLAKQRTMTAGFVLAVAAHGEIGPMGEGRENIE
jgi:hypothetical protein